MIGQLGMHEFVRNDINASTFGTDNDTCSIANKICAAMGV